MNTASPGLLGQFSFPLNVYARAVELEEGRLDYLHYGLHEHAGVTIGEAQKRSTELVFGLLPPAPCRLLEVGIGIGTTLSQLVAAGYQAVGITPEAAQADYARSRFGASLPVIRTRLEDFSATPGGWRVMLLQESAQYIDPLDLFEKANLLLDENGEIVIADEFALRRAEPGKENLHLIDHFLDQAARFGFEVVDKRDVSREAAPTTDYLLHVIQRHAAALQLEFGLGQDTLAALNASNEGYRRKYAEGRYGYFLLRLRRASRPRWRVGRIDAGNSAAMRDLFKSVFGHEMSEAHWRWKYGEGHGNGIGVWEEGQLVAHYGGVARDILYFGRPYTAAQSCDVMVAPAARGTLSRHGPLFLAAATYLERELGYGNPHLLGFGFPNRRAWMAPKRMRLYDGPVGHMVEVSWPTSGGEPPVAVTVRPLDLSQPDQRSVADGCWQQMAGELSDSIVCVRDGAALYHRYAAHPGKRYEVFLAQSARERGIFIICVGAPGGCELLDVVGPLGMLPRLVEEARRIAGVRGTHRLFAWVTSNIANHLGTPGSLVDIDVFVPANAWTAAPPIQEGVDHWWLMGGDTDFH